MGFLAGKSLVKVLCPRSWTKVFYKEDDEFRCFANSMIALAFVPPTFLRVAWRGVKGEDPVFANHEEFSQYFQDTWIDRNLPVRMWNVHYMYLDGPHTNNHAKGWHSKVRKLAGKAHPNIYEVVSPSHNKQPLK